MSELENIENSQEVETIPTGEVSGRGLFMSELENIENSQEVETIPTGEVSGEVSGEVPEDNSNSDKSLFN